MLFHIKRHFHTPGRKQRRVVVVVIVAVPMAAVEAVVASGYVYAIREVYAD